MSTTAADRGHGPTIGHYEALRYTLPALDGTVWLGLRPAALGAFALGVAAAVSALSAGAPLPMAGAPLLLSAASALVPVAGRTPLAWAPTVLTHGLGRLRHTLGWTTPIVDDGPVEHAATGPVRSASGRRGDQADGMSVRLPLPAEYGRVELQTLTAPSQAAQPLGVVRARDDGTVTVVFEVAGTDRFGLLDPTAQDSQLARWGTCLAALAGDPRVQRLQWLTHTRPDTRDHAAWLTTRHDEAESPTGRIGTLDPGPDAARLREDYATLARHTGLGALTHQHLLALTLTTDRASAGHGRRDALLGEAADALVEHLRDLATILLTADLLPHPLSPAELGTALRRLTDPTLPEHNQPPEDPRQWSITSRHCGWDGCRTDDTLHRSFAVTGWPRLALPADWLAPVLHTPPPTGTGRTLAVHALGVPPQQAARQARAAHAKARLDAADRSRLGFTGHATDSLAETDAAALETELVAGYRLTQLTALVTISAPDRARLTTATQALRALSVSHRLDLRPLHGQHQHGLVGCLPLGRPLPGARR